MAKNIIKAAVYCVALGAVAGLAAAGNVLLMTGAAMVCGFMYSIELTWGK